MEVVGAVSSIVSLIQFGGEVLVTGYGFINKVREAPVEVARLLSEVARLLGLLVQIDALESNKHNQAALESMKDQGVLDDCSVLLTSVRESVQACQIIQGQHFKNFAKRLTWPFKDPKDLMKQLGRLRDTLTCALSVDSAASMQRLVDMAGKIDREVVKNTATLARLDATIPSMHYDVRTLKDNHEAQEERRSREKLAYWLCPVKVDPSVEHSEALQQRDPNLGTGRWFLESTFFSEWQKASNQLAWLHAIPGCGKTTLFAAVVECLRLHPPCSRCLTVYFYCGAKDPTKRSFSIFLYHLAARMLLEDPTCIEEVERLVQSKKRATSDTIEKVEKLSQDEYVVLLKKLSHRWTKVLVLVDALDEASDAEDFVDGLQALVSSNGATTTVQALVTSRNGQEIKNTISRVASSEVSLMAKMQGDIEMYIEHEVRTRHAAGQLKTRDHALVEEVTKTLRSKAGGMFLRAKLHLDHICEMDSSRDIRQALHVLPTEINDIFVDIVRGLKSKRPKKIESMKAILRWLVGSRIPLSLSELAEALAIRNGDCRYEQVSDGMVFDPFDLATLLGSLVTIQRVDEMSKPERRFDPSNETSRQSRTAEDPSTLPRDGTSASSYALVFVHGSIKEFLRTSQILETSVADFHMDPIAINIDLGRKCLQYLRFEDFKDDSQNEARVAASSDLTFPAYYFLRYAACYWPQHLRLSNLTGTEFYSTFADPLLDWFLYPQLHDGNYLNWQSTWLRYQGFQFRDYSQLRYSIELQVNPLVELLLQNFKMLSADGKRLSAADAVNDFILGTGLTPLHVAARCGNLAIVRKLLQAGSTVDLLSGPRTKVMTAMHYAAEGGHASIVKELLSAGASPHARTRSHTTPFYRACRAGSVPTMTLLHNAGSDIDARSYDGWSPFHEALHLGHTDAVNLLLSWGAIPDFPDPESNQKKKTRPADLRRQQNMMKRRENEHDEKKTNLALRAACDSKGDRGVVG